MTTLAKISWEHVWGGVILVVIELPLSNLINYNNLSQRTSSGRIRQNHTCEEGSERDNNYDGWIEWLNTMRNEFE